MNQAEGLLIGSGAGGLSINQGSISNQGTVEALDDSSVTYRSATVNLNNSGGTLTGGTWEAIANGHGATLSITGGPVVTDAAKIVLSGAGSVFRAGNGTTFTPLENSLTAIDTGGELDIVGGRTFTTSNTVTDGGLTIVGALSAITNLAGALVVTGTLSNSGTVQNTGSLQGVDLRAGGSLVNHGVISGLPGVSVGGSAPATASTTITNFGTIGGNIGVMVNPLDSGANTIVNAGTITGTSGTAVSFRSGNDRLIVNPGAMFNGSVLGGAGNDTLVFAQADSIPFAGFVGFETIQLSSAGANALKLANGNFAGTAGTITVNGGNAGNTVDASGVTGTNRLVFVGGVGADVVTGDAGNDLFVFTAATLTGADTVAGGGGSDQLKLTSSGTINVSGVSRPGKRRTGPRSDEGWPGTIIATNHAHRESAAGQTLAIPAMAGVDPVAELW